MYMTHLSFALIPLLSQLVRGHDPHHRLCDLIALPLSEPCNALTECKAIQASNCQDDTCACAYTAQAETCVQCMRTDESVNKYNDYLGACVSLGQAAPTTAHTVSPLASPPVQPIASNAQPPPQVSPAGGQFTDVAAAMGVESQVAGSTDLEPPVGTLPVAPIAPVPAVTSASVYRGIGAQTQVQAAAATALPAPLNAGSAGAVSALPNPLNGAPGSSGSGALDPHGISVLNDTTASPRTPPSLDAGTTALNSSRNFFSQAISQACVRHCVNWKTRADVSKRCEAVNPADQYRCVVMIVVCVPRTSSILLESAVIASEIVAELDRSEHAILVSLFGKVIPRC